MDKKTTPSQLAPLSPEELTDLFYHASTEYLMERAGEASLKIHGEAVFLRGLIEFSNYCNASCLYCGIRGPNGKVNRYRMNEEEILRAVEAGFAEGLRTFVLQGGEDIQWKTKRVAALVERIKKITGGQAAVTLSLGMKTREEYRQLREAGGDRYLIRFETSDPELHVHLRDGKTLDERLENLAWMGEAGFQRGSGFMTGLPGETPETRLNNILLCRELELDMVGIGPFIPHPDTPLGGAEQQGLDHALRGTALLRLALPQAHIPATTAAGSLVPDGREQMVRGGANVLMPNLTDVAYKKDYLLYPGKICLDESGLQCIGCLSLRVKTVNRKLSFDRGDALRLTGGDE
ncbi:MAG: [FeFe] hydrogenase H-cluster radical SAM maturase HydE [Spirochaetales bacterium]|nr:[FeFe] hydrogenase H-cluster radical SAM maturase HydE [Spirochaetales bacterium]